MCNFIDAAQLVKVVLFNFRYVYMTNINSKPS